MSRIHVIDPNTAVGESKTLLDAVQTKLGITPNFLKVLANSPAALAAFLGLHSIAGTGELDLPTRERIAVALAEQNSCEYCLSAHSAIGRKAGLSSEEIAANRDGASHDAKAAIAVAFARSLMEHKGEVSNSELDEMRRAGYGDAEIVEIIVHVGMNFMTNVIGKASRVEIDFPKVELKTAA
jgi:uncharacterized peroxidase-related enzyme